MNIIMLGTGYVGLVSGTCFSEFGFNVCCVDTDNDKIGNLNNNIMPIYEPGLSNLVKKNKDAGRLSFSNDIVNNIKKADVIFIAVGTPTRRGDGHADLTYIYEAAELIGKNLNGYTVIVTKSTVPVGTGVEVKKIIKKANPNAYFDMVSNPEFLREGNAIGDFMKPDRVVVGLENEKAKEVMTFVYKPLYLIQTPIIFTDLNTAELIKYSANAFLAVKISFINQIADLCEKVDADVHDVARGIGLDNRIGSKFLHPGPGYGGSCFPKDTKAITSTADKFKTNLSVIKSVIKSNQNRSNILLKRVHEILKNKVKNKNITFLGVTFKANTDDMRDSSSLIMIPALSKKGAFIKYYDPTGYKKDFEKIKNVSFENTIKKSLDRSDLVIIHTEWNDFKSLNFKNLVDGKIYYLRYEKYMFTYKNKNSRF